MNNLTDQEIRTLWKNRDLSPRQMILCLSQLEGCEYHDMRDYCESIGLIREGEFKSYKRPYTIKGTTNVKPFSCDEIKEVFRMRKKGMTYKEMASVLGRSITSISHCLYRYGSRYGRSN